VDNLLPGELDERESIALDHALREAGEDLGQILRATAQMLGRFTHNIAIMAGPREREDEARIGGIELYDRGGGRVLLALSLRNGAVRTELVTLPREVKPGILLAASSFLAERLSGHTLEECRRELEEFLGERHDEARSLAFDVAHRGRVVFSPEEILQFTFEGIPEALQQPEFADSERLKALLQLIARHELFEQALEEFVGGEVGEVRTAIGQENPLSTLHPFTLMATRFDLAGQTGYLGVLGPRRMRDARALALIHGIAGYLDRMS
jgi:heat-inducible transcriptional repressor